jgi:hypothetical protein
LIERLADALLRYERGKNTLRRTSEEFLADMQRGLEAFLVAAETYRKRPGRKRTPSIGDVEKALQTLTRLKEVVTTEDILRGVTFAPIQEFSIPLVVDMSRAFAQHGPSREAYPDLAVYHAIAAILAQLKVEEHGTPEQIAERLRKRQTRAKNRHRPH